MKAGDIINDAYDIDYEWLLSKLTPNPKANRSNLRIDLKCLIKTTYNELNEVINIIAQLDKRYAPIIENDSRFLGHDQEHSCLIDKRYALTIEVSPINWPEK